MAVGSFVHPSVDRSVRCVGPVHATYAIDEETEARHRATAKAVADLDRIAAEADLPANAWNHFVENQEVGAILPDYLESPGAGIAYEQRKSILEGKLGNVLLYTWISNS